MRQLLLILLIFLLCGCGITQAILVLFSSNNKSIISITSNLKNFKEHNTFIKGNLILNNLNLNDIKIYLLNTNIETSLDKNGNFFLENIKPGEYTLIIEDKKQSLKIIKKINLKDNDFIELNNLSFETSNKNIDNFRSYTYPYNPFSNTLYYNKGSNSNNSTSSNTDKMLLETIPSSINLNIGEIKNFTDLKNNFSIEIENAKILKLISDTTIQAISPGITTIVIKSKSSPNIYKIVNINISENIYSSSLPSPYITFYPYDLNQNTSNMTNSNKPPVILSLTAYPNTLSGLNYPTKLKCIAQDDDNILTDNSYTWSTVGNYGIFSNIHGSETYWIAPNQGGIYKIKVKVTDGINTVQEEIELTVTDGIGDGTISSNYH